MKPKNGMKKQSFVSLCLMLPLFMLQSSCGSQSVAGVYSGVELSISPMMGGGMDRSDVTYYLRADKTFTDEVEKPGWEKRVDGTWSQSGKKITVTYKEADQKPRVMELTGEGNLQLGTGYVLQKMEIANSIPKGVYEYKYASGSGGVGTNVPYVGVSGNRFTAFDGKGNFTRESSNVVALIGDNVGGGSSNNKSAYGTYTVKNGTLTFQFADGTSSSHSLFVAKDFNKEGMIFVDGEATFKQSAEDLAKKLKENKEDEGSRRRKTEAAATREGEPNGSSGAATMSAGDLLARVRAAHGGKAIDGMKTSSVRGTVSGLEIRAINDYERGWVRTETRQNGKLLMVEQLEGNTGWQWTRGKRSALAGNRIKEMQAGLYTGFGGLQQPRLSSVSSGTVRKQGGLYTIVYKVNGSELAMLIDKDFKMKGEAKQTATGLETITYENFRDSNGLLVPFTEVHSDGKNKISISLTDFQVNKATAADWAEVSQ